MKQAATGDHITLMLRGWPGSARLLSAVYLLMGASASAATTAKVREAAEALGYRPNRLARSLTGKSYMVGLVVAYLDNYFYPEVVEKLSHALQQRISRFDVHGCTDS